MSVFVKIDTDQRFPPQAASASFTGVEGPLPSGNALGSCGQIIMGFAHRDPADNDPRYNTPTAPHEFTFAKGWSEALWLDLLEMWKRYHMESDAESMAAVETFAATLPDTDRIPAWA